MKARDVQEALDGVLPNGWEVELRATAGGDDGTDLVARAPDGRCAFVQVRVMGALEPRDALRLLQDRATQGSLLIASSYLSPATRERLLEGHLNYLDLTGNIHFESSDPGLFIHTDGADANPSPPARRRSLKGAKAGRIIRALIELKEPPGVRELAEIVDADPGYVSRILSVLDREALIERTDGGRIRSLDWERLLRRWAADVTRRGPVVTAIEPRGLSSLLEKLAGTNLRYAVTGSLAASKFNPIAASRMATIYTDDASRAVEAWDLRETRSGANVTLIDAPDPGVYTNAEAIDNVIYVAPSQVAADLLHSTGREPAEGEALITWMSEHEEDWRG